MTQSKYVKVYDMKVLNDNQKTRYAVDVVFIERPWSPVQTKNGNQMCKFKAQLLDKSGNALPGSHILTSWDEKMFETITQAMANHDICSAVIYSKSYVEPSAGINRMDYNIVSVVDTGKSYDSPIEDADVVETVGEPAGAIAANAKPAPTKAPLIAAKSAIENIDDIKSGIEAYCENNISNDDYKSLIADLILDNPDFFKWKAAYKMHHAYEGGLAIHSYFVAQDAIDLANRYNGKRTLDINWDLLITGALLHDIGKLKEYDADGSISGRGQFESHMSLGIEMIDVSCAKHGIDPSSKDIQLLKHIIASHHGSKKHGAIIEPIIPEAYIIHYADNLDAKMEGMLETWEEITPGDSKIAAILADDDRIGGKLHKPI